MSFKEWLKMKESSALTRLRADSARGLKPPMADYMSRSTPPPWEKEQHDKKLKKNKKKKKSDKNK
jgi:hypothetical protein